ncbi:MAG TPA: ribulose-phosphate 3-epimerase [Tenericutes bacterium]|nr:ribulose-phosphate 3-epimerase [Mycoplasmatota bacterium]
MKIAASYLAITDNLEENINLLDNTTIDYIHVDVMDGIFVQNKTYDYEYIESILKNTKKKKDVHLMVKDVYNYIDLYSKLNPEYITVHIELEQNLLDVIKYIKQKKIKAGISINPGTYIGKLDPYLSCIDLVLIMSVEPGYGGQKFLDSSIEKIYYLINKRKENNYNYVIEVDGGINDETINIIDKADIAVVGSFITNSDDYQKQVDKLKNNQ